MSYNGGHLEFQMNSMKLTTNILCVLAIQIDDSTRQRGVSWKNIDTIKTAHAVTSIKQSSILKGDLFCRVIKNLIKNWMHSFEVSLGYESVDWSTFSMKRASLHVENVVRSMLSYPNETSKECIQFL